MNFERYEGEAEEHLIWRVYSYQKETGEITTKEAGEICNRELKVDFDESRHRKIYESFDRVWRHVKDEFITEEGILDQLTDIDSKKDELYKQKVKTRDALREYRKHLRDEARIEELKENLYDAHKNAEEVVFSKYEHKHKGDKESVVLLSDFHVGIAIENYWNTYNKEVFESRLNLILQKILKYCKINSVGKLTVVSLGDVVSGSIHATTRLAEEMDVLDQTMYVAKAIKNLLYELVDFGLEVDYVSTLGNHDRLNKNYKEHIESESFNKIIDWYINDKIEDGVLNVNFIANEIDEGIAHFEINGEQCFAVHGHNDSPDRVIMNIIMATNIIPKYIFMGHYHHKKTLDFGSATVFVNGSLVGVDEYAKTKRLFSKPSQTMLVFDDGDVIDIKLNV